MRHTFIAYYRNRNDKPCSEIIRIKAEGEVKIETLWKAALKKAQDGGSSDNMILVTLSRTEVNVPFSKSTGGKELLR